MDVIQKDVSFSESESALALLNLPYLLPMQRRGKGAGAGGLSPSTTLGHLIKFEKVRPRKLLLIIFMPASKIVVPNSCFLKQILVMPHMQRYDHCYHHT